MIESRADCHISECTVSIIVVKCISSRIANKDILVAVVVVVGHRNSETVSEVRTAKSGLGGHIFKCSVAPIAQKAVVISARGLLKLRKLRSIGKEQVHPAVVVVVDGCHSTAHGNGKILPSSVPIVGPVRER